ncbi:MAG: hypothetical protein LBU32_17420 [Clostridiales bacterium]|jgi:hypothetical protein|nr:hypothetical protein [Clostridiales bacterium]
MPAVERQDQQRNAGEATARGSAGTLNSCLALAENDQALLLVGEQQGLIISGNVKDHAALPVIGLLDAHKAKLDSGSRAAGLKAVATITRIPARCGWYRARRGIAENLLPNHRHSRQAGDRLEADARQPVLHPT